MVFSLNCPLVSFGVHFVAAFCVVVGVPYVVPCGVLFGILFGLFFSVHLGVPFVVLSVVLFGVKRNRDKNLWIAASLR